MKKRFAFTFFSNGAGQESYNQGAVGATVSVFLNLLLAGLKLAAGILGHSSAMIADAFHSISDVLTSVTVLVGMKIAAKPADKDHPWGHGKAEAIAAKIVAVILILIGIELGLEAVMSISRSDFYPVKPIAMWAAVISILVKEWNFQYIWRMGKRLNSISLKADAWHHRSDAISSVAALIGIAFTIYGGSKWHFMDHLAAIFVAVMIVCVGFKFFRQAASDLMDRCIPQSELTRIRSAILQTSGVMGVEVLTARKSGMSICVEAHVEVDPGMTVLESHEVASNVRDDLKMRYPQIQNVLVHIEPYFPGDH
ncbi:MAG: cation transporter [candidate division Zixibacteria bacterium]|nr:cation transporter [Candidatus Tariuqbacter arcticus]